MKNTFLYIGFVLILLTYFNHPFTQIILIILSCIYYYFLDFKYKAFYVIGVVLFCVICVHPSEKTMIEKTLKVDEIRSNYVIASNRQEKCILFNVNGVNLLDVIEVKGKYEEVYSNKNLNTYQFEKNMKRKGINSSMYVQSYQVITSSNRLQAQIFKKINAIKDDEIKTYLNKMFYRIDEDKNDFSFFIFASGMHLSFLIYFVGKYLKKDQNYIGIIISIVYFICFPKTYYIVRIFFFSFIPILCPNFNKKDQLGLSIIVLLLYDASILYEICFVLPVLFRLIYLFDIRHCFNKTKQLLILIPIQLICFNKCNILNVLLFPLFRMIGGINFIFSIMAIFFSFVYPFLKLLINIQDRIFVLLDNPFNIIGKPYLIWIVLWVYFSVLLVSNVKKKYFLVFSVLLFLQANMKLINPFGEVTSIDVGQGDCILIREPMNGEVMLIDVAGKLNKDIAKSIIYPVLNAQGIKRIDKVVITHDDYDHSGGLSSLKKLIKIESIIMKKPKEIKMKWLKFYSFPTTLYEDKNDNSIVLYSNINGLNYLFMADASKMIEQEISDKYNKLKIDIIKIGHHGSKTSSDLNFIHQIHPLIGIISSGKNNFYGHPHKEVIDILKKERVFLINTQVNGSSSIYFHRFFNFLATGRGEFGIISK